MSLFQVTVGAGLQLDAAQAVKALLGAGAKVYNILTKSGMQVSTLIYGTDVSMNAADSAGWRKTLQSIELRQKMGFEYADLLVGYPAHAALPQFLKAEYGPRWLGILAIACFIPSDFEGGSELHGFLKAVAATETREYVLSLEQTEKMWTLGREIFLDTVVWHQFLFISLECSKYCENATMVKDLSGYKESSFPPTMMACLRLWALHGRYGDGRKLYAQGYYGTTQLVLYLSVVCGFHVTVRFDEGELCFGDEDRRVEVIVRVDPEVRFEPPIWQTCFLVQDATIEDSLRQHVIVRQQPNLPLDLGIPESLTKRTSVQPHISTYVPKGDFELCGSVNLFYYGEWKDDLDSEDLAPNISAWLSNCVQALILSTHLRVSDKLNPEYQPTKTRSRRLALCNRLKKAIEWFDPGFINKNDVHELLKNIRNNKKPSPICHPLQTMGQEIEERYCLCSKAGPEQIRLHNSRSNTPKNQTPEARHLLACFWPLCFEFLQGFAWTLWTLAHVDFNEQKILRDLGPIENWKVDSICRSMELEEGRGLYDAPETIRTLDFIKLIAQRLTGRPSFVRETRVLGVFAGGAVVGLKGNEYIPILDDPGHCIFIYPGIMETQERVVREMWQSGMTNHHARIESVFNLDEIKEPQDQFGEYHYEHEVELKGDCAEVRPRVRPPNGGRYDINLLSAIDNANDLRTFDGCLDVCAAGQLNDEEKEKVAIAGRKNYRPYVKSLNNGVERPQKLTVVLAHENVVAQRAIISHVHENLIPVIQTGTCVHCAVRYCLKENATVLFD